MSMNVPKLTLLVVVTGRSMSASPPKDPHHSQNLGVKRTGTLLFSAQ